MILENLSKTIMKQNNKILILGKGYVGGYLYNHLLETAYAVEIKSREELDYHDPSKLSKYILNNNFNCVINCSGFTGRPNVDQAELEKEECWKLNVIVPLSINQLCHSLDINYLHISTGCLYDGYDKAWTETDVPNFGLFQNHSSFYSRSKHAFENLSQGLRGIVLRIRMPFGLDISHRNYFTKIKSYPSLLNLFNSKTYIPDLCKFVQTLIGDDYNSWKGREIYNVVNPEPLKTEEVCEILKLYDMHNSNWKFVERSGLKAYANRSNCVLDTTKSSQVYHMLTEKNAIFEYCKYITSKQ